MNDLSSGRQTRRQFLRRAGGAALGLTFVSLAGCEENLVAPRAPGTEIPFLIPVPDFYEQFGGAVLSGGWGGIQHLARDDWSLTLDGLVANPLTLRFDDLEAEQDRAVTVLSTMRCITDTTLVPGLIGNTLWTGIPLRLFLDRAGIDRQRTRRLRLFAPDRFTNNLKIERIYGPLPPQTIEPLLVFAMNGAPLTPEHGFPVRLLVPNLYGYKSVKWIQRIEATDNDDAFGTYQETLGYTDDGVVRVVNKVTNPLRNEQLAAGPFKIFGYALSGFAGIQRVEVSVDDGPFEAARIVPLVEVITANPEVRQALQLQEPGRFFYPYQGVWALWEFAWQATPGAHTIRVRAVDREGNVQPATDDNPTDGDNPISAVNVMVA